MSTTNTPKNLPDPLLDEIRAVKESVSAEFGHDVVKLCQQLRRDQASAGKRVVRRRPPADAPPPKPQVRKP
jgi:hypothetical protein